jgi:hypothetical protein
VVLTWGDEFCEAECPKCPGGVGSLSIDKCPIGRWTLIDIGSSITD